MHLLKQLLNYILPISLFVFLSCRDTLGVSGNSEWVPGDTARTLTFVYMMAENSLASYATSDLVEMYLSAKDVPDDCYMIAFVDDTQMPRICRFYSNNGSSVCDTVYCFETDFCSSDTAHMRTVFDMVMWLYPAKAMNLVMWSHGTGWLRESKSVGRQRSIGVDNGRNSGYINSSENEIEIPELAAFIASLKVKPQLLMFDACFMQSVEVAYELRNCVDWILASPAEIPADGAPYHKMTTSLFASPFNVLNVMNSYYDEYDDPDELGVVLSLVDCREMDNLASQTSLYVQKYFPVLSANKCSSVFSYLPGGHFPDGNPVYPDFFDVNSVMKIFMSAEYYAAWKVALEAAVPYKCSSDSWYSAPHRAKYPVEKDVYSGISMYIPQSAAKYALFNEDFGSTAWYIASGWEQAGW